MAAIPSGTVTFLFTDVEASTRRWEDHPDDMRDAMALHDRIVRDTIEAGGGSVFTTAGDQFCAAFSAPQDAVMAAVSSQTALASEDWGPVGPLRVRMAVHSGNADERDGDYFGPPLNRCARLLSAAHGGQIVVSSSSEQLLQDDLPAGVAFKDLGAHALKDLNRPEHVYQVLHEGIDSEFPPLRSETSTSDTHHPTTEAREAFAQEEWERAYVALVAVSETSELEAEDYARLGEAAFWTGRHDESIGAWEKTYSAHVSDGEPEAAALAALLLARAFKYRLAKSVSKAWVARAERLVGQSPGTEAYGYLLRWKCVAAFESEGDAEKALDLADQVTAVGLELGDRSLEALGLQDKGRFLVAMGNIDEGMSLMDEAMIAAVAGELSAEVTGASYCNMLAVCDELADYERAAEWSDAAQAWCELHPDSSYPGVCRIFRAELRWLHGDWEAATSDLNRAIDELTAHTPIIGAALYQIGEVELRAGRFAEAEKKFLSAHEHGFVPMPGMAALRLAEGDGEAAEQLLRDALETDTLGPLSRAQFLPTLIDTEQALGRTPEAREALNELEHVAELTRSTAMRSAAAHARASLALVDGDTASALRDLRTATKGWTQLQMPYEAARSRLLLAEAQRSAGNATASQMEAASARSTFERLGASLDVERVDEFLQL